MAFVAGGIATTGLPVVGALLSFGAPILALVGLILGGVEVSRRGREGQSKALATTGLILSAVAFLPALTVALTCGLCNAMCMGPTQVGGMNPHGSSTMVFDGGAFPSAPAPIHTQLAPKPDVDPGVEPSDQQPATVEGAPPPAFPPPPIQPSQQDTDEPDS